MIVKENHKKNKYGLLFAILYLISVFVLGYIFSPKENRKDIAMFLIIIIPLSMYLLYEIGYVTKTININNDTITFVIFKIIRVVIEWEEVNIVQICTIRERTNYTYKDFDAIVCSTIPIKMKEVPEGMHYKNVVLYDWISLHHKKVLGIYLNDLKPGQYEEFWSYVPERLKGNFKPEEQ